MATQEEIEKVLTKDSVRMFSENEAANIRFRIQISLSEWHSERRKEKASMAGKASAAMRASKNNSKPIIDNFSGLDFCI
jgi:hypothetical protein